MIDLQGKAILFSRSMQGVEPAIARAFEECGALCFSPPAAAAETPRAVSLLDEIQARCEGVTALVHSVQKQSVQKQSIKAPGGLAEYSRADLHATVEAGVWPVIELLQAIHSVCGSYPRYVVVLTTTSAQEYSAGADFEAVAQSALETLCRYLSRHLQDEDICINIIRYRDRLLSNDSTTDKAFDEFVNRVTPTHLRVTPTDIAGAVVALCSGLMDCVRGQVLTVDRGALFSDNLMRLYGARTEFNL